MYDEDIKAYTGKVRVYFSAYGGMRGCNFQEFCNHKDMESELDLIIHEKFLEVMNGLIKQSVFITPKKRGGNVMGINPALIAAMTAAANAAHRAQRRRAEEERKRRQAEQKKKKQEEKK